MGDVKTGCSPQNAFLHTKKGNCASNIGILIKPFFNGQYFYTFETSSLPIYSNTHNAPFSQTACFFCLKQDEPGGSGPILHVYSGFGKLVPHRSQLKYHRGHKGLINTSNCKTDSKVTERTPSCISYISDHKN